MIISNKLSRVISSDLSDRGLIEKEYRDSYAYCLEFLFDVIFFNISLILIGLILHRTLMSVVYVFTLTPIKTTAGGAHARSRLSCEVISYAVFFAVILLPSLIAVNDLAELLFSIAISITIILLAPVEVSGRPAVIANKKSLKCLCGIFSSLAIIIDIIFLLNEYSDCADVIFFCLIVTLINQLIGNWIIRTYEL